MFDDEDQLEHYFDVSVLRKVPPQFNQQMIDLLAYSIKIGSMEPILSAQRMFEQLEREMAQHRKDISDALNGPHQPKTE